MDVFCDLTGDLTTGEADLGVECGGVKTVGDFKFRSLANISSISSVSLQFWTSTVGNLMRDMAVLLVLGAVSMLSILKVCFASSHLSLLLQENRYVLKRTGKVVVKIDGKCIGGRLRERTAL